MQHGSIIGTSGIKKSRLGIAIAPLCAYPAQAAYNGAGHIDDAANFHCVTPKLQERTINVGDIVLIQNALRQRAFELPNR